MAFGMAGTIGDTFAVEPEWLDVAPVDLPIRRLPSSLVGRRLVQFSDIHVGPSVSDDYVRATFATASALQPDIVVLRGELISWRIWSSPCS